MKNIKLLVFFVFICFFANGQQSNNQKFYVGTFTSEGAEGIYLCNFNSETGDISLNKTFKGIDNPSFLKISNNKKYLYVVTRPPVEIEESDGFISAYKIRKSGSIQFLNKQVSNGKDPCYIDVSENDKFVAIATYGSGTTSLYPVKGSGKLLPATSTVLNKGSGVDKSRQTGPHAHSIQFSPFSNQVFNADLGTDQFNIFNHVGDKLVQTGQEFVKIQPGGGPRHFEFHPGGEIIYVINELNSTVTVVKNASDNWDVIQNVSTLPVNFEGKSYCADIHISTDGKFLYGSNRGHNSIVIFAVNPNSKELKFIKTVSVEGNWPRNFALTPNGKFMLVANQKSGNITVFKIHPITGVPEFTGKELKLPAPVCLEFL